MNEDLTNGNAQPLGAVRAYLSRSRDAIPGENLQMYISSIRKKVE
jgi:hypothetical protein